MLILEVMMRRKYLSLAPTLALVVLTAAVVRGQDHTEAVLRSIDAHAGRYTRVAQEIWDLAEVGYQEVKSCALLQEPLQAAGFTIEAGIADLPTAFVATYGQGAPVIALLAEYDALPGITQAAVPERKLLPDKNAGHACGHHLFGTGSTAAAIAIKDWLVRTGTPGTVRLYGTPAEEGGAGKVYIVRAGLFSDVDAVLHWHAADRNDASPGSSLAYISAKFQFRGVSAHAAVAPERGRSALDGVEAMNFMVNMLREHVPEDARIHYVITNGGSAPNVVPDSAEVFHRVRHPDVMQLTEIFDRLLGAAEGAALGTGTTVEHDVIAAVYPLLPNEVLARVMDRNLRQVGGVRYSADEQAFAEHIRTSLPADVPPISSVGEVQPFAIKEPAGSTDVADVSWVVPTTGLRTATWVPGTAPHSWQAVAAGGTSIGIKGMLVAAKTLTLTAIDLFSEPRILREAQAEYQRRIGPNFMYRALVGDRPPPLNYRQD